jgi:2-methylcitrate dehydratase
MAARQSAAPPAPSADKAYDPEIQDMANYIHQYNVDSDLAVSFSALRNGVFKRG